MLKHCYLAERRWVFSTEMHRGRRPRPPLDEEKFEIPHALMETLDVRGVNGQLVFVFQSVNSC